MFCFSIVESTDSTYSKILLFVKQLTLENHFLLEVISYNFHCHHF